jgi:hypothetical protein
MAPLLVKRHPSFDDGVLDWPSRQQGARLNTNDVAIGSYPTG